MLQDKLNVLRAASAERIPPETMSRMLQIKGNRGNSGILERTIKAGEQFPDFVLTNEKGMETRHGADFY